jgi:transcriptional regulator with XRE-family HTH domain
MTTKAEGARLRTFRLQAGLTQKDLAKECGVSVSTISAAEVNGRGIRLSTLLKICKALNIRPEQLADESDKRPEAPEMVKDATFKDLLARHQESERNLWLYVYKLLDSPGEEMFSPGPSGPMALGRQGGTPRIRGRSQRKS